MPTLQNFATSDAYNLTFKVIVVVLAAIGVILTPVYLLSIIGVGLYPKILTQIYDATTMQLTERLRHSVPTLAHKNQQETVSLLRVQAIR